MEKVNILNQMEQYDFSSPINVTMIFEDSDDDTSCKNILKEQHRNNNNKRKRTHACMHANIQEKTEKSNTYNFVISETKSTKEVLCKENIIDTQRMIEIHAHTSPNRKENKSTESSYSMPDITNDSMNFETVSHQSHINKNNCSVTKNTSICEDKSTERSYSMPDITNDSMNLETASHQSHLNKNYCSVTKNTSSNICEVPSETQANETGEINEDVKKQLDIVSENLTLIMMQYYYIMYNQSRQCTVAKAEELKNKLNQFKSHFFGLSYSTVVSIILPQEKNELFTNKFLEKTVDDANKKLSWKCNRRHIEPFYNEMLVWVKHKRNHVKTLKDFSDKMNNNVKINDNRSLKDRLNEPPRALYIAHTTNIPKELGVRVYTPTGADLPSLHDQNVNADNNMCIFSSGTTGNNISISINPDILVQQTKQYFEAIPQSVNCYNTTQNSTNSNIHRTNSSVAPNQAYDQRFNNLEQNGYPQRPTTNHRPITSRLPTYNAIHKVTSTPTNYRNLQQKNMTQSYQTQQNMNPTAASVNASPNIGQMHYSQLEERLNTTPVISQVTSLNPNHSPNLVPFPTHGRCCICGKTTTLRCSRCQNFSYCSYLCQELDAGHKTMCRHIICR